MMIGGGWVKDEGMVLRVMGLRGKRRGMMGMRRGMVKKWVGICGIKEGLRMRGEMRERIRGVRRMNRRE